MRACYKHVDSRSGLANEWVGSQFKLLVIFTTVLVFVLITVGGVVRLTDSGLGCPDWPMCHGKIIPPLDKTALIEYSHRLMASIVGLLVIVVTIFTWRRYRKHTCLFVSVTTGLVLLIMQVILGAITVLRELPDMVVLAHLAVAEAMVAAFVVACVASFGNPLSVNIWSRLNGQYISMSISILAASVLVYCLILVGSYVSLSGATTACGQSWPLCQGSVLPSSKYQAVHMTHRYMTLIVGIMILWLFLVSFRLRDYDRSLLWSSGVVLGLFVTQSIIGASIMWTDFGMVSRLIHLSTATLIWTGLIGISTVWFTRTKHHTWLPET